MCVYVHWCVCRWMCLHLLVCAWPAEARRGFQILLELETQAMVSHRQVFLTIEPFLQPLNVHSSKLAPIGLDFKASFCVFYHSE